MILLNHPRSVRLQYGFTLVELLVVMVVLSILGSIVAQGLNGAYKQANFVRSRSLVDRIYPALVEVYDESANERTAAVVSTAIYTAGGANLNQNGRRSLAMSQLIWRRDLLRCRFPDRIDDVLQPPVDIQYQVNRIGPTAPFLNGARLDPRQQSPTTAWYTSPGNNSVNNAYMFSYRNTDWTTYRQFVVNSISRAFPALGIDRTLPLETNMLLLTDDDATNGEWTTTHQSAECLYMIFQTHALNGEPLASLLNERDVADTDSDGMLEIVDAYGRPVGFLRWPVGHFLKNEWVSGLPTLPLSPAVDDSIPSADEMRILVSKFGRDSLDSLLIDPRFQGGTSDVIDDPFAIVPLIVSAGQDGRFDMVDLQRFDFDPTLGINPGPRDPSDTTFALSNDRWIEKYYDYTPPSGYDYPRDPVSVFATPATLGTFYFIDPFPYTASNGANDATDVGGTRSLLPFAPGAHSDVEDIGEDNSADNIYPTYLPVP